MKLTASFTLLLAVVLQASSVASDFCTAIAGQSYVVPSHALACLKSFPHNETIKDNVMSNVERVMDFYAYESYYLDSPSPFQESTIQIRSEFSRIRNTTYQSDYDFHRDLYHVALSLNDGHTMWSPSCYTTFQNLLPTPIISLFENGEYDAYIAPDAVDFISLIGQNFTGLYDEVDFDWKRLAGAKVVEVENLKVYDYIDYLATTQAGLFLDHGARVNSVFTSYHVIDSKWSQRLGIFANRRFPEQDYLTMEVMTVGANVTEKVHVPYFASYSGAPFTDQASFWAANCAVKEGTNGVNRLAGSSTSRVSKRPKLGLVTEIKGASTSPSAFSLPTPYIPTLPSVVTSSGVLKSYFLPDGQTGVIYVTSFGPSEDNFNQFQSDVDSVVKNFTSKGVTKLLLDLHDNTSGYVCLGLFMFNYLAGKGVGYPGFESTIRANELSKKIVAQNIKLGLNSSLSSFASDNWAFLNGTVQPGNYNYVDPPRPFSVNGVSDPTSQRFHDTCESTFSVEIPDAPPFKPENIAMVGNANCASTCALFSTLMYEKLGTKVATFGGRPGQYIEYKGAAGNQFLDWPSLDSEIKTAGLKDDPLAPPDLIIDGGLSISWRTAWSLLNESNPIAYQAEPPQFRFDYTNETYNNPQNLWIYSASKLFSS